MSIFYSKKFQMAIAGVIVAVAAEYGLELDTATILVILSPILTYIAGQGLADIGKEKVIADAAIRELENGDQGDNPH